ncbi:MAG: hypothetical protein JO076_07400 [Verrucomicrobia bacterium]|nr:hypothetical protein [Verrucomicrobiota bacterium]
MVAPSGNGTGILGTSASWETINTRRSNLGLLATAFCWLSLIGLSASLAATQVDHSNNGVWLGHAYVTAQSYVDNVATLAQAMKDNHSVLYWFVNVGKVNSSGQLIGGADGLSKAVAFLNALNDWEASHGYRFTVLAWINGTLMITDADYVDVSDATKRHTIVDECKKLISTTVPGSYVAGAVRTFDGIQIDFEPSGQDSKRFDNLKMLMDEIHGAINTYPGKHTSFVAPKQKDGTPSQWFWSSSFYYAMGRHVDILAAMTYDSGEKSGELYENWMRDQTISILRSVSGKFWDNGPDHPSPENGIKVMLGFPAFPANAQHDVETENIKYAAPGVDAGLKALRRNGDPSRAYFQGAVVFLQTDGTGKDHFASTSTDWWWFSHYWLQER